VRGWEAGRITFLALQGSRKNSLERCKLALLNVFLALGLSCCDAFKPLFELQAKHAKKKKGTE